MPPCRHIVAGKLKAMLWVPRRAIDCLIFNGYVRKEHLK